MEDMYVPMAVSVEEDRGIEEGRNMINSLERSDQSSDPAESTVEQISLDRPPKRQLTAYNLFFQSERRKLLDSLTSPHGDTDEEEAKPSSASRRPKKKKNRKTKPHGKIGFADLARTISTKWAETVDRQVYHDLAEKDKARYQAEMKQWKKLKREESRKSKKAAEEKKKRRAGSAKADARPAKKQHPQEKQESGDVSSTFLTPNSVPQTQGFSSLVAATAAATSPVFDIGMAPNAFVPVTPIPSTMPHVATSSTPKVDEESRVNLGSPVTRKQEPSSSLMDLLQVPTASALEHDASLLFPPSRTLLPPAAGLSGLGEERDFLDPTLGTISATLPTRAPQAQQQPQQQTTTFLATLLGELTAAPASQELATMSSLYDPLLLHHHQQAQLPEAATPPMIRSSTIAANDNITPAPAAADEIMATLRSNFSRASHLDSLADLMGEECLSEFVDIFQEEAPPSNSTN